MLRWFWRSGAIEGVKGFEVIVGTLFEAGVINLIALWKSQSETVTASGSTSNFCEAE